VNFLFRIPNLLDAKSAEVARPPRLKRGEDFAAGTTESNQEMVGIRHK
jgi:hypothetical protein